MISRTATAVNGLRDGGLQIKDSKDSQAFRKPTGSAAYNRKITPGKKQSATTASGNRATSSNAAKSNLMARARSSEAVKDRVAAQKRAGAQQSKNLASAAATKNANSTTSLLPVK